MDSLNGNNQKPYVGFTKLDHGLYEVVGFRFIKNRFYKEGSSSDVKRTLLVELNDQVLFLPSYFAKRLNDSDEKLNALNAGEKKYMHFEGKRDNT